MPTTGNKLADLGSADDLCKRFDVLRQQRWLHDIQWKLNLAFYKGRQYSYYNRSARRIEELPTGEGEKPRYRVRLVSNQIVTGAQSLLSKLTKTRPVLLATPGSSDECDVKTAQVTESLLEYWWDALHFDAKVEDTLLWSIITGQGYMMVDWDSQAGTPMTFCIGPDGKPITDPQVKAQFYQQLREQNIDPSQYEKTVYLGDIRVQALSPFQVYFDPGCTTAAEAKYCFVVLHMTPEAIKARYNVDVEPDSVPAPEDATLPMGQNLDPSARTLKRVHVGFFLPQAGLAKGRIVTWVDSPKKVLEDKAWDLPVNKLPVVKFPGIRIPGQIYDSSWVEHALPLQQELNRTLSQIVEFKNLTVKPRVWAPRGSLRTRLTNEPGAVYEFNPIAGLKPEVEAMPAMQPYVFEHLNNLTARIKDVFCLTEVSEGSVPPNVEAGIAIDLLQEMSIDRIEPIVRLFEHALGQVGQLMITLAQAYYIEPRLLKILGSSGKSRVVKFTQSDLKGGVTVRCETGSGLPRTRAGRTARIQQFVQMGLIEPRQAWKYVDLADMRSLSERFAADEEQAQREHDKLVAGEALNLVAVQQAMQALQQSAQQQGMLVNPETGQPFQSPQDVQAWIKDQSLQPTSYEDYATHIDVHTLYMKSNEFEALPPEIQQDFVTHLSKTRQAFFAIPRQPDKIESVRTSLQLKGTVGPEGAAALLNRTGVPEITPDIMREPPLETWVSDALDKDPDGAAGNNPERMQELQMHMQMEQEAAQAQQQMAHENNRHQLEIAKAEQQHTHAEQQHQHGMAMDKMKARQKPSGPKK